MAYEGSADHTVTIELNPREARLYDRLRARIVEAEPGAPTGLAGILLLMPDMVVLLARLARDPRVPLTAKTIAALGIAYTFSPIDLIPELVLGPIGWIDDVLIVGAAVSRVINHVHPDIVRAHWPGQGDALSAIQRISQWIEQQVTGRLQGVLKRMLGARA